MATAQLSRPNRSIRMRGKLPTESPRKESPVYTASQLKTARTVVVLIWIVSAACFFFPLYYTSFGDFGRILFGLLIALHLVEFPIFAKTYLQAGGSLIGHFPRHMAYGLVYRAEVQQRLISD